MYVILFNVFTTFNITPFVVCFCDFSITIDFLCALYFLIFFLNHLLFAAIDKLYCACCIECSSTLHSLCYNNIKCHKY